MILDQLHLCPFCHTQLYIDPHYTFKSLACPRKNFHRLKQIWGFYLDSDKDFTTISPHTITSLNIEYNGYQLHFYYKDNTTSLYKLKQDVAKTTIINFSYILDFELTEDNIDNKIKNILTFK